MYLYGASGHGRVIKEIIEAQAKRWSALAAVLNNIPDGQTAVGVSARIIEAKDMIDKNLKNVLGGKILVISSLVLHNFFWICSITY